MNSPIVKMKSLLNVYTSECYNSTDSYIIQTGNRGKMYSYFLRNHWKLVESFVCAYIEIIIIQMHCWSYNNVC